jgi:hypothetical protein
MVSGTWANEYFVTNKKQTRLVRKIFIRIGSFSIAKLMNP